MCVYMRGMGTVLALKIFWLLKASTDCFCMCHVTLPPNGQDLQNLPQLSLLHPVNPLTPQPPTTEGKVVPDDTLISAHPLDDEILYINVFFTADLLGLGTEP